MKNNKKWGMLALIMMFWFTISFITNILGPLIPDIIHNFELKDLAMAGFIPTSFFLAYAIMSIPAGILRKAGAVYRFPYAIYRNRLVCMFPILFDITGVFLYYRLGNGHVADRN